MNFAPKWKLREPEKFPVRSVVAIVSMIGIFLLLGCSDNITLPTPQELAEFEKAGPIGPELDMDKLVRCRGTIQDYRIQKDDLLKITFPTALVQIPGSPVPYTAQYTYDLSSRVDIEGNIILPVVESIHAEGLSLQELEAAIVKAFYPRYTSKLPTIVARVDLYHPCQVSVTGAVKNPGVYELAGHRLTLVSAIMAAGGILETGAASIRIRQPGDTEDRTEPSTPPSIASTPEPMPEKTPPVSNLRMTFSQIVSSGEGVISIKDGPKLLYAEQLDVTNAQQRRDFYDRVSKAYPQISGEYVSTRLYELAEVIDPGSARSDLQAGKLQVPAKAEPEYNSSPSPAELGSQPLLLPVKGMNIPFSDIALTNGSVVEVEQINPQVFTVIGLVRRAGAFPYPPNARYTLLDALGFAGGVDEIIDPRFVRVYRRTTEGKIVDSAFELKGFLPTSAAAMWIKPGDVIAVEQTPRTRTNLILSQVFRINLGGYYNFNPNN